MKNLLGIILLVFISSIIISCKKSDDPKPSAEEMQLIKLSKTWRATEVKLKNIVQTGYTDLRLTLSGNPGNVTFSYGTTGRPNNNPWPATGTWQFGSPVETKIIRDVGTTEELEMNYTVTENQLQLNFNFNGAGYQGSRTISIEGAWSFTFIPG